MTDKKRSKGEELVVKELLILSIAEDFRNNRQT
jgi:hypothetical protein